MYLSDVYCDCVKENGSRCGKLSFVAADAALVKDTRSPCIASIDKVFSAARSNDISVWDEHDTVNSIDLMKCISFEPTEGRVDGEEAAEETMC